MEGHSSKNFPKGIAAKLTSDLVFTLLIQWHNKAGKEKLPACLTKGDSSTQVPRMFPKKSDLKKQVSLISF